MELVKLLPVHVLVDIPLIFLHGLVLCEYWVLFRTEAYGMILQYHTPLVLVESRIPLKSVLRGVRIVAVSICSHEHTQ